MPPAARRLAAGPCTGAVAAAVLVLAGCGVAGGAATEQAPHRAAPPAGAPALEVETVLDGLDHPWDVARARLEEARGMAAELGSPVT